MFISGKRSLPVPVGWRDNIMRLLRKRSGGSTYRANTGVLITKKEIEIRGMDFEATASQ